MVLKYISKDGKLRIHGPPYTKAEEAEFYRRNANGPVTVARGTDPVKRGSPEHRNIRRRQSQRAAGIRERPRKADKDRSNLSLNPIY